MPEPTASTTASGARAAFAVADQKLLALELEEFDQGGRSFPEAVDRGYAVLHDVKAAYDVVLRYGQEKWSLAAMRRKSYAENLVLEKLRGACERSVPPREVAGLGDDVSRQYQSFVCNQFRKPPLPASP